MPGSVQRTCLRVGGEQGEQGPAPAFAGAVLAQDKLLLIMSLGNGAGIQPTAASTGPSTEGVCEG